MLDYEIIKIFRPIIKNELIKLGLTDTKVLMNYQQEKQGIVNNTVYFHILNDKNVGALERVDVWNQGLRKFVVKESQAKETTFQIDVILKQNPNDIDMTAKDICTIVNLILQKKDTIKILQNNGIGILWISEIRNVPFVDSDDNYSFNPSFDFTISHNQSLDGLNPYINNINNTILIDDDGRITKTGLPNNFIKRV